jgi:hypothetical protein
MVHDDHQLRNPEEGFLEAAQAIEPEIEIGEDQMLGVGHSKCGSLEIDDVAGELLEENVWR